MIRVHAGLEELSSAAADVFLERAAGAIRRRGRFDVALAGGHTPKRAYELLAEPPRRDAIDWSRVHVFWGDERCVPADDERSNARMTRLALIDRVPMPPGNVHAVACDHANATEAAAEYESVLRRHFGEGTPPRWDLVFLGLGADGHTASLTPASPLLVERERWVGVADAFEEGGPRRVTLTPVAVRSAAMVVFLVAGKEKAGALHEALAAPTDPARRPVHAVTPVSGDVLWLADTRAAGDIPPETPKDA